MGFIPEDKINEIKDQINIVNIISEYVELKKSGNNYIGLCPFHNEKTPSFTVSNQKSIFHCFGCGEGGDVITFIMKKENLTYPDAIYFLADKLGIFIKTGEINKELYDHKKRLYMLNNDAKLFFYQSLLTNQNPQNYVKNRSLEKNLINTFTLGYADKNYQSLLNYMIKKGYKIDDLLEVVLVKKSLKNNSFYDAFRERLIFPIMDLRKNIIGFGGRALDDNKAKYINSPESIIYHKSDNIYGVMNLQNITKLNKAIIVEGYIDVISLSNYGINYAVASLGTSLTTEQAKLILRYSKNIYICYDGDEAGINATKRAINIFKELNISPYIIQIPENLDPDDYIKKYGSSSFNMLIKNAVNPIIYKYNDLILKYNINNIDDKVSLLKELTILLSEIDNKLIRDEYISKFSEELRIDKSNLLYEVNNNLTVKDDIIYNKSNIGLNNGYKTILLESLRFILYNNSRYEEIIKASAFLEEKTKYWAESLKVINMLDYTSNISLKVQISNLNLDSEMEQIFKIIFKIRDIKYYENQNNLNHYLNSMDKNKMIIERDILKERFSLLENNSLNNDLKNVYNQLAMDILELDRKIKNMK